MGRKMVVSRLACREGTRLSGKVVVARTYVKQCMGVTAGWLHLRVALVLALICFFVIPEQSDSGAGDTSAPACIHTTKY